MSYSYRNSRRSAGSPFLRGFITVISLAVVSFGLAFFWQQTEDSMLASAANSSSGAPAAAKVQEAAANDGDDEYNDIDLTEEVLGSVASVSEQEPESGVSGESSDSEEEGAAAPSKYEREAIAGSVPPSKPVGYGYFKDAIFFGDSISVGIPLYMQTMVPDTAVIAAQGVTPSAALTSECITSGDRRVTMLEAAKTKGKRSKVYLMFGANALDYDEATVINGYIELLKAVKAEYPEAVIYVQSILPVTANVNNVYPSKNINNERIEAYNKAICKMALENDVHYVDVAQGIVDADGMLPTEASPLDGMHLSAEYYIRWFDYLRDHTLNAER